MFQPPFESLVNADSAARAKRFAGLSESIVKDPRHSNPVDLVPSQPGTVMFMDFSKDYLPNVSKEQSTSYNRFPKESEPAVTSGPLKNSPYWIIVGSRIENAIRTDRNGTHATSEATSTMHMFGFGKDGRLNKITEKTILERTTFDGKALGELSNKLGILPDSDVNFKKLLSEADKRGITVKKIQYLDGKSRDVPQSEWAKYRVSFHIASSALSNFVAGSTNR